MNTILKQVSKARNRMFVGRFFTILMWALFACLILSAIAVSIPRIWVLEISNETLKSNWDVIWISLGSGFAVLLTAVLAWVYRTTSSEAAVEVDQRFRLKDRLASALMLDGESAKTSAGQALIDDAEAKAEVIDVRDEFPFRPNWRVWLPLIPAVILAILLFVPNAVAKEPEVVDEKKKIDKKAIKVAIETAKKKIKKREARLSESGLKDALQGMELINNKVEKIAKGSEADKKQAFSKINDIKKQLNERQKQLGGAKEMKRSLAQLAKSNKGPASKIADAMKAGDMKAAKKAIKDLVKKMRDGKLSETEKKRLANDIKNLAKEMQKIAERRNKAMQKLKDQIRQAKQNGDLDKAARLQQQFNDMQAQQKQMDKLKQIARKMQKAADAMKKAQQGQKKQAQGQKQNAQGQGQKGQQQKGEPGQPNQPGQKGQQQGQKKDGQGQQPGNGQGMQDAADALEDIADDLNQMQQDLEDLKDLEDLQDDLDDLKNQMGGGGDGDGFDGPPKWNDWSKGAGTGGGKRADETEKTGKYDSRVKGKLKKGQTVRSGFADGANRKGVSREQAREVVESSMNLETDPLENQKLPRSVREHASQYFEKLRKGE